MMTEYSGNDEIQDLKESLFSKLMKYREEADYNPSYVFTREDFIGLKKEAEGVINKITSYLKEKDYLFD